jgi:hypothetical protein
MALDLRATFRGRFGMIDAMPLAPPRVGARRHKVGVA